MQRLDVDQGHPVELPGGVVDVARQGQVDQRQRRGAPGRDVAGLDGEAVGAGRGDRDVDVGKHLGAVLVVDDLRRDPGLLGVSGEALGALAGAVGDDQLLDAQLAQVRRRQRRHGPGAQHERRPAAEVLPAVLLPRLVQGEGDHGGAGLVDLCFGVDALAHVQGRLRQRVQARSDGALVVGLLVGGAHLADDLLFADDHGIQARGHHHHVFGGRVGVAHVQVAAQGFYVDAGDLLQDVQDVADAGVERVGGRVDLEPVTGRDDHRLR